MANEEGPVGPLLTDANKLVCENCNGSKIYIGGPACDENTDLRADTKAYLWENSAPTAPYGDMQTIPYLCGQCGFVGGFLLICMDVCTARGAGTITGTHIAAVTADGLIGLYVTVLGGTDAGVSFGPIIGNTAADPTVITFTAGTPNLDAIAEDMWLSTWKVF